MNQVRAEKVIKPLMAVVITGIFLGIYVMIPAFYSTLWQLTVSRDIQGLSAYIASFGSAAVLLMILLIILTNMTGLPSVQFVTVNGILFGLLPGIVISWIGQVAGMCWLLSSCAMCSAARHAASWHGAGSLPGSTGTSRPGQPSFCVPFPIRPILPLRPCAP